MLENKCETPVTSYIHFLSKILCMIKWIKGFFMFMCYPICVTCVTFCFCLILALLKPLKNQRVSDFFRGYRKRPVVWNELKSISDEPLLQFVEIETRFNSHYIKKCPYKKWKDGCQFFLLFNSTVKLAFSGVEIFSLLFKKKNCICLA